MSDERRIYRLLTGPSDASFCDRVSEAIADGYVVYGSPSITDTPDGIVCAQAVILPDAQPKL